MLYPVFDGNIYRLDLQTGKPLSDPLAATFAFKGTGSVHPLGLPLLFAGQGLDESNGKRGPFEFRMFDLLANKQATGLPGADKVAPRNWGAFDASALIHAEADTLWEPGENGLFYRVQLNSAFDGKSVRLAPKTAKMKWHRSVSRSGGAESSPVAY